MKRTVSTKRDGLKVRAAAIALFTVPAVIAAGTPSAFGATGRADGTAPVITNLRTVAAYDFAAGGQPESVTINPDGSQTLSLLGFLTGQPPQLLHVSRSGQSTVLVTGRTGEAIGGNTRGPDGTIYFDLLSGDPTRSGIWALPSGGSAQRIGALPTSAFPNGLAIDAAGTHLYATDSLAGSIWTVPTSGGTGTTWLADPALAPAVSGPGHFGANGIKVHDGAVWATNTDRGTMLRIPITATGAPGPIDLVTSDLPGVDDFSFLSDCSDVAFVALNFENELAVVYPDGNVRIVLTAADGLDSPSDTAVRGDRIYISNGGDTAPHDAKLQTGTIDLAALFVGETGAL